MRVRSLKSTRRRSLACPKQMILCFCRPLNFSGEAVNIGGTIELSGSGSAELELLCDRCADSFSQTVEFEVFERLKKEDEFSDGGEEDPNLLCSRGSSVDLDEIVYKNLYMNLPSKRLCDEDCKGLCSECGVNLNRESCNCSHEVTDPDLIFWINFCRICKDNLCPWVSTLYLVRTRKRCNTIWQFQRLQRQEEIREEQTGSSAFRVWLSAARRVQDHAQSLQGLWLLQG